MSETNVARECGGACGLEAIHSWFGLTYANYLVLNRSVLQSMPDDWQSRFVECLEELQEAARDLEVPSTYAVQVRGDDGRFEKDPVPHYNRGRARVELQPVTMRHTRRPVLDLTDPELDSKFEDFMADDSAGISEGPIDA